MHALSFSRVRVASRHRVGSGTRRSTIVSPCAQRLTTRVTSCRMPCERGVWDITTVLAPRGPEHDVIYGGKKSSLAAFTTFGQGSRLQATSSGVQRSHSWSAKDSSLCSAAGRGYLKLGHLPWLRWLILSLYIAGVPTQPMHRMQASWSQGASLYAHILPLDTCFLHIRGLRWMLACWLGRSATGQNAPTGCSC